MSQRLNRRRISPVRIRPTTEPRRTNPNADIQRIVNHASKLIVEYNKSSIEKVMESDINNHAKVNLLLRASKESFPKILSKSKSVKSKSKRKRNRSSAANYHSANEGESDNLNHKDSKYSRSPEYSDEFLNSLKNESYKSVNISSKKSTSLSLDLFVESNEKRTNTPMTMSQKGTDKSMNTGKENIETRSSDPNDNLSNHSSIQRSALQSWKDPVKSVNEKETIFLYEIEMKTADKLNPEFEVNIWIQLNGEYARMEEPILLNDLFREKYNSKLFQTGSVAKLIVNWKQCLGMIESIKVALDSKAEKSVFFLDYVRVKDCSSEKDYLFSCGRWLGTNNPDKLSKITLAWLPPLDEELKSSKENLTLPIVDREKSNVSNKVIKLESFGCMSGPHVFEGESRSSLSSKSSETNEFQSADSEINNEVIETPHLVESLNPSQKSIHEAIENKDFLLVKELCDSDAHMKEAINNIGYSPIHIAAIHYQENNDSKKIIDYLLSLSVDINQVSVDGYVSLHYAIINGNLAAVKYLIEIGKADPTVLDRAGNTLLQLATEYGSHQIIDYLEKINVKELLDPSDELLVKEINQGCYKEEIVDCKAQALEGSPMAHNSENEEFEEKIMSDLNHDKDEYKSNANVKLNEGCYGEGIIDCKAQVEQGSPIAHNIENEEFEEKCLSDLNHDKNEYKDNANVRLNQGCYEEEIIDCKVQTVQGIPRAHNSENEEFEEKYLSDLNHDRNEFITSVSNGVEIKDKLSSSDTTKSENSINRKSSAISFSEKDDDNILEILEDDQLEEEVRGIMFHKSLPLNKYPKKRTLNNINNESPIQNSIKANEEEISCLSSQSNATSLVSSRPQSLSTISPRSHSSENSSEPLNKVQLTPTANSGDKDKVNDSTDKTNSRETENSKTNKPSYSRKEPTEQLSIELMKYEPFPTIDEVMMPKSYQRSPPIKLSKKEPENVTKLVVVNTACHK